MTGTLHALLVAMLYSLLAQLFSLVLDLFGTARCSHQQKDLEILLLRQQVRILQRKHPHAPRPSRLEKLALAVVAAKLTGFHHDAHARLDQVVLLFKPDTLLKWHRELVRRKWTFKHRRKVGRPSTTPEIKALVKRLAQENPTWGYSKIHGELLKLGYTAGRSTVRDILIRLRVPPAPERTKQGSNWSTFLGHYRQQILACDFFTLETVWLKTLYALFFIELGSRRVYFGGCTAHPTAEWVAQQARQLTWTLQDRQGKQDKQDGALPTVFLIHDRDAKFPASFDRVFASERIEILKTPYRSPKANAYAERWVRSVREECLDRLLIINEAHLRRVLREYVAYYNEARPHQGIYQRCPIPIEGGRRNGGVKCRDVLGGILHDYHREAA